MTHVEYSEPPVFKSAKADLDSQNDKIKKKSTP
jgi:hypothetical protein